MHVGYASSGSSTITITTCTMASNTATGAGGVFYLGPESSNTLII